MNIIDRILERADRSAVALASEGVELTFGELFDEVDRAAEALRNSGILDSAPAGAVPRLGLACPNGFSHVILAMAVLRIGGCLVPVASELTPSECDALICSTGLHALIFGDGEKWHRNEDKMLALDLPNLGASVLLEDILPEDATLESIDEAELAKIEPAFIRFSSGTTGKSKGIVLSHQSLYERVTACNAHLEIGPNDRVVWILPMAHHFAVSIVLYLLQGATTIIVSSHYGPDVLKAGREHKGTVVYGSPFHHSLLAAEDSGEPWPSLRLAVSTAAALPLETAEAFRKRYGLPLSQALGIIEIGLPLLNWKSGGEKPKSVGPPQPAFEVVLRDPDTGENIAAEEIGELLIKGPGMFDAYLSPWTPREDALTKDGFFQTGDLARQDADGCIELVGRSKSVINVAGMKAFPEEIEQVLARHDAVAECRVIGKEHPDVGNVPIAEVVLSDPENPPKPITLLSHCRKYLSRYKVPIAVQFVDELPRTASGKIRRV